MLERADDAGAQEGAAAAGAKAGGVDAIGDFLIRQALGPQGAHQAQAGLLAGVRRQLPVGSGREAVAGGAYPFAAGLLFGQRVNRAFADDAAFPLRNGHQNVELQLPGGALRVQTFADADQGAIMLCEQGQQDAQVLHRTGDPVQLGDHHAADGSGLDGRQQAGHLGALQTLGRETGILIEIDRRGMYVLDGQHGLELRLLGGQAQARLALFRRADAAVAGDAARVWGVDGLGARAGFHVVDRGRECRVQPPDCTMTGRLLYKGGQEQARMAQAKGRICVLHSANLESFPVCANTGAWSAREPQESPQTA